VSPEEPEEPEVRLAVDGVLVGPVSKEHPAEAQPVAAGPTKVGAKFPRLDDVTPLVLAVAFVAEAALAPTGATTSATTSDSRDRKDRSATLPRIVLSLCSP
jgi:hypothetical protein